VLCACALGDSVAEAQRKAYGLAGEIRWPEVYYRKDIGYRAIQRG
jgi:phosphoribosylamine--glycine ligase